jgi:Tfp pilus assembly protein PilF
MWNVLKRVFFTRMSQKTARGVARSLGVGANIATVIGVVAAVREWRKQQQHA